MEQFKVVRVIGKGSSGAVEIVKEIDGDHLFVHKTILSEVIGEEKYEEVRKKLTNHVG